ncbi:MAG: rhomboid family intramembrane serine protease [Cyanobacteria bacterium SZAS-4]|nr:rhomboid family intramembrane serine protease [Cyanobacteria bacterium SZAS-4]
MNNPFVLWLFPPLLLSVYSLWSHGHSKMSWAWCFWVQGVIIIITSLLGFFVAPGWLWAGLAWGEIFLFWAYPRVIVARMDSYITVLNADAALQAAKQLRWFYWGQPAEFWRDMVLAVGCFIKADRDGGNEILDKWKAVVPKNLKEQIESYRLTGNVILWNWQYIVDQYELQKKAGSKIASGLQISASRAYGELGDIEASAKCLEESKLDESRSSVRGVALSLMPYFCLSGDRPRVDELMELIATGNELLPEYARLYWRGRCLIASDDKKGAREIFDRALESAKSHATNLSAWQSRIDSQLKTIDSFTPTPDRWKAQNERVWRIFQKIGFIQDIVAPNKYSWVVACICITITFAYLISDWHTYFPGDESVKLSLELFQFGVLDPKLVLSGQYWRLLTCLFLHKTLAHCFVNVLGLYWFGRIAQNIFGTPRFLAIFFMSGMLSGVAHTLLAPDTLAVGASGAVMGIFGAVAAGIFRMKEYLPDRIWRVELYWLAALAVVSIISDQIIPQVAVFAHMGGMVAGLVFGLIVRVPKPAYAVVQATPADEPSSLQAK